MVFCGSGGTTMVDGCACWTGAGVAGGVSWAEVSFAGAACSATGFLALVLWAVAGTAGLAAEACSRFRQEALAEVLLRLLQ